MSILAFILDVPNSYSRRVSPKGDEKAEVEVKDISDTTVGGPFV